MLDEKQTLALLARHLGDGGVDRDGLGGGEAVGAFQCDGGEAFERADFGQDSGKEGFGRFRVGLERPVGGADGGRGGGADERGGEFAGMGLLVRAERAGRGLNRRGGEIGVESGLGLGRSGQQAVQDGEVGIGLGNVAEIEFGWKARGGGGSGVGRGGGCCGCHEDENGDRRRARGFGDRRKEGGGLSHRRVRQSRVKKLTTPAPVRLTRSGRLRFIQERGRIDKTP